MKKLLALSLCAVMALSLSVAALAADEPLLISPAPATDEPMVIAPAPETDEFQPGYALHIDGVDTGVRACVMVPLRAVAEKLGFEVVWNGDNTITVTGDALYADLTLGEDQFFTAPTQEGVMGASLFSLGVPPYAVDGVTYVPLGLFDALLGSQQGAVTMTDNAICLDTDPLSKMGSVQLPSPIADYETLAEAAQAVGFELAAPDALNGSDRRDVSTISNELLQVIYRKGEDETARVRKAHGTEDISGDYNIYAETVTHEIAGMDVTLKGDGETYALAVWSDGEYAYSLSTQPSLTLPEWEGVIAGLA